MADHVTPDKRGRLSMAPFLHPELKHTHYRVEMQPNHEILLVPLCSISDRDLEDMTKGMIRATRAGILGPKDFHE